MKKNLKKIAKHPEVVREMSKTVKIENKKEYHILVYVMNCSMKLKKFDTTKEMGEFIDKFNKKYPESQASDSGYWTDFAITGVTGDVHFFTDNMELT